VLALIARHHDPQVDHRGLAYRGVLTDYHVHLRPDDPDASPAEYFTTENVERYLAAASETGIRELGVSEHVDRFTDALEIWDHPAWRENARDDLGDYCEFVRSTPLRLGIEMDYLVGREDRIGALLDAHEFDYVVGSVHFIRDRAVDWDVYDVWDAVRDPDRVWSLYFEALEATVRSGLYDILAHPDLVKVWGDRRPTPRRDPRFYYEPTVEAIAETGIAVEVSTAGLRKPVGELYPSDAFAEMCVDAGASFALSSDAHVPEDVGRDYDRAVERMGEWGIAEIAVFERRRRRMEPLG
jgi:histidinol-phosphatase (PHP family)